MHTSRLTKLIKTLSHSDASKRRSAAEVMSEGDERAIYPLIKALRDENFGVQDAAMRSLIAIGGEVTAYMVLPLLRENSFLRNTALIILKEIGKVSVPLLYPLLSDKDDDVRKFALDLIYDIRHCDYPEKIAGILKEDPNANVRAAAAKATGVLQHKETIAQLIDALKDDEWVCFSALEALAEIKDETSIDSITALLNSPSDTIRYAAIEAIGKIGSSRAGNALIEHISKTDGLEKTATIKSLVQIGTIPSIAGISDTLIDMLTNGDWEEKNIALKGLVNLKEKSAIYPMVDMAGSLDPSEPDNEEKLKITKDAIQAFGCADTLIDILGTPSVRCRGKVIAIEVVGNLKCKRAVPCLIKLLSSEFRDVRRASIKSLAETGSDDAKEFLIDAINDYDSHVRKSAVAALGTIGEMAAFEPLIKLLHTEKYNDVIEEIIKCLLKINSSLFLSHINDFNDKIRDIAARFTADTKLEGIC